MDNKYILIKRLSLILNIIILVMVVATLGYFIYYLIDLNNVDMEELSKGDAIAILMINVFSPAVIAVLVGLIVLLSISIANVNKSRSKVLNIVAAIIFLVESSSLLFAGIESFSKYSEGNIGKLIIYSSISAFAIINLVVQIFRLKSMNSYNESNN